MNSDNWRKAIEDAKNGNDTLFSKVVNHKYNSHFNEAIAIITKDKDLSRSLYTTTMTTFWERFVIQGEKLPNTNIDGYIFQMAKNAFILHKRQVQSYKHSFVQPMDTLDIIQKYSSVVNEQGSVDHTQSLQFEEERNKLIHNAVRSLDKICKEIVEQNILNNVTLKTLRQELGLKGTYSAIVQKKKRCIRRLKNLLLKEFKNNKTFSLENLTHDK